MPRFLKVLLLYILILSVLIFSAVALYSFLEGAQKEEGIDLYGTYDQNSIVINSITDYYGDAEIKIPLIDGLKNEKTEDLINRDIYKRSTELLNKYSSINYGDFYTYANFSNVISIYFSVGFDEEPYSDRIYLNYNLTTGERLRLEDLFIKDTDLTDIIRSAFYESFVLYGMWDYESETHILDENKLYKTVKNYLSKEDKMFSFTPREINFYQGDEMASIEMLEYADIISIYSKYLTKKSIYTDDSIGYKNIFTCADSNYGDMFEIIDYGYTAPNLWSDITVGKSYYSPDSPPDNSTKEAYEAFSKKMYGTTYEKLEEYKKIALENPDKFYIFIAKPNCYLYNHSTYKNGKWHYTYSNGATWDENIQVFEMPMSLYEEVYKDKIIDSYRYQYFAMRGGVWLDTENTEGAIVTEFSSEALYNYITGEEYTSLEEIFDDDYDYMSVIKKEVARRLSYDMPEEAESLIQDLSCELCGSAVLVTIPARKGFEMWVYFADFDYSKMKIFN